MSYIGKVRVHDVTEPASVAVGTANMGRSIFTRIVTYYATETERDNETTSSPTGVGVKMTDAEKRAMVCWVDSRGGFCYWDPTSGDWEWVSVHRKVTGGTRASAADSASITPGAVIPLAPVALPPGNRLLHIEASGVIQNLQPISGTAQGRLFVTPGLPDGDSWLQSPILAPLEQITVSRPWYVVASGTVQFQLYGLMVQGTASGVRFTNTWIQVFDEGPCDD